MQTNYKESESRKSLYVFLCSLLGVMLFAMLQKSALLLLTLFLNNQIGQSQVSNTDMVVFDVITYIVALFFGGWYGVWLGLHWYEIVYESGRGGVFHNMISHVQGMSRLANAKPTRHAPVERPVRTTPTEPRWQFDDLVKPKPFPKPARMDDVEWTKKVSVTRAPKTSRPIAFTEEPVMVTKPKRVAKKAAPKTAAKPKAKKKPAAKKSAGSKE